MVYGDGRRVFGVGLLLDGDNIVLFGMIKNRGDVFLFVVGRWKDKLGPRLGLSEKKPLILILKRWGGWGFLN